MTMKYLILVLCLISITFPVISGVCLVIFPMKATDQLNSRMVGSACIVDWLVVNYTALTIEVNVIIELSSVVSSVGKNVTISPQCGVIYCDHSELRSLQIEYDIGAQFGCYVCECAFTIPCGCPDLITTELYGYDLVYYAGGYGLVLIGILMIGPTVWYLLNKERLFKKSSCVN